MIKISIPSKSSSYDDRMTELKKLRSWCLENIGPAPIRGKQNQKNKKLWDIKRTNLIIDGHHQSYDVYIRDHAIATYFRLLFIK